MADSKISVLPASTTPLAGTETLPIVQSGITKKVTVSNLTAGRAVSALSGTFNAGTFAAFPAVTIGASSETSRTYQIGMITGAKWALYESIGPTKLIDVDATGNTSFYGGNLIQGTATKGINFTANTSAAGMTSQLLNWYEEGTFTPTITSASGVTTLNSSAASYTRVGNIVMAQIQVNITTDASVGTSNFTIGGLPFTSNARTARGFVVTSNWTSGDMNDGNIQMAATSTTMVWINRAINASSRTSNTLSFQITYRT